MSGVNILWKILPDAQIKGIEQDVIQKLMAEWTNESTLSCLFMDQLNDELFANVLFCQLRNKRLLRMRFVCGDTLYFELEYPLDVEFSTVPIKEPLSWDRFAYMHTVNGVLTIESPSDMCCVKHINPMFAPMLLDLNAQLSLTQEEEAAKNILLNYLLASGFVVRSDETDQFPDWEFHDRLFYAKSTIGCSVGEKGKRSKFPTNYEMPQMVKPSCGGEKKTLAACTEKQKAMLNQPFIEVLNSRRSCRRFEQAVLSFEDLSVLLSTALIIESVRDNLGIIDSEKYKVGFRPSPSGGALHSLEVYVIANSVEGLPKGTYHYCPLKNELEKCSDRVDDFCKAEVLSYPHARLIVSARMARTSFKYTGIALRLILLDLGCMLQTLMLTAEAVGIKSCINGVVEEQDLKEIPTDGKEWIVGELVIGK